MTYLNLFGLVVIWLAAIANFWQTYNLYGRWACEKETLRGLRRMIRAINAGATIGDTIVELVDSTPDGPRTSRWHVTIERVAEEVTDAH